MTDGFEKEMRDWMRQVLSKLTDHEVKDEGRHAELMTRVTNVEDDVEVTGQHQIDSLHRQLKDARESQTWIHRNWLQILISILSLTIAAVALLTRK